jgi:predicted permease
MRIAVDWRVLVFIFALSILSGLLLGVAPAWVAAHPLLGSALKGEDALARPGRRWTLRNLLTIAQIAMSVILLSMTGLFLRSLQTAGSINLGFRPQNLLSMSVDPRLNRYTPERTVEFLDQLQARPAVLPGVLSAAWTDHGPLSMARNIEKFHVGGGATSRKNDPAVNRIMVTPGYFETMGIPRVAGRDFAGETASGPKTAVVNRAFAERLFGSENPIGQQVTGGGVTYQIVGVVGNVKTTSLGEELTPVLYRSLQQNIGAEPSLLGYTLVVHTAGHPAAMGKSVRQQIYALDRNMAVFNEETMEEHVHTAFFLPRLAAMLFGVFGGIGLVLATVGLYGVMSYAVSRRTREIGIRMAMGAQPGTVERLVLRQGFVLTLIAVMLGWPAAWMLAKLAASFLYGIRPHDMLTFAMVPPLLSAIALVACWIPARRAASVDPMVALRTE